MAKKEKIKGKNEDKFRNWLTRRLDETGKKTLEPGTQGAYFNSLKNSIKQLKFKEKYHPYQSVFDIDSLQEFERIIGDIKADEEGFKKYNSHSNFNNGIKAYWAFLGGEGEMPEVLRKKGRPLKKGEDHKPKGKNEKDSITQNPRNLIFFGAPGTGKSYTLNDKKNKLLDEDDERCTRVTFHPDYSYAHFVGTYKPVPDDKNSNEITYKYVPGPFMETYVAARENPDKVYVLVIEEINRANVAAVFGDVFQLLDRTKDGESEYPIKASEDIQNYLKNRNWTSKDYKWIKIPKNMYIWATMNSADQGVFPMDTAFKRRWDFEYLGINTGDDKIAGKMVPMGGSGDKEWNKVRTKINDRLAALGINEDKQLGAFFINAEIIDNALKDEKGKEAFKSTFKNKVLMYLFDDAAKHKRSEMFSVKSMRYSEICKTFDNGGLAVFKGFNDKPAGSGEQTEKTTEQSDIDKPENTDGEQHS